MLTYDGATATICGVKNERLSFGNPWRENQLEGR